MKIHELDKDVVDKIAAGEVVEGPYSVVRELIENSIDAGSDKIAVRIYSGGKERIEVSDNGDGIQKEDLPLAVRRYATSKLRTIDDLYTSRLLGFRGEALASIGAVSHLELCSFCEREAYKIVVEFGRIVEVKPCSLDRGTVVVVEGLFSNLPARMKFLKSAQSEGKKVASVMESYILGFPSISFDFWSDDRRVYSSNKDTDIYDTWVSVFGKDIADKLELIERQEYEKRIMAVVSSPYLERHRPYASFMVNGHPVRSGLLRKALTDAYTGYLPPGWAFVSFVRVDVPPSELDFNVHPAKWEVRFKNESAVYRFVYGVVRDALSKMVLPEGIVVDKDLKVKKDAYVKRDMEYAGEYAPKGWEVKESVSLFGLDTEREFRVLGQIWNTYILVEKGDYFYIVDQHVASEKIIFEKLLSSIESGRVDRQRLMFPKVVDVRLDPEYREMLEKCGFEIEDFGENRFIIRAVPSIIQAYRDVPVDALLKEAMAEATDVNTSPLHALISSIACRSAIKAGKELSLQEQEALLRKLFALEDFLFCPHGRPIILEFKRDRIEEMFKRK